MAGDLHGTLVGLARRNLRSAAPRAAPFSRPPAPPFDVFEHAASRATAQIGSRAPRGASTVTPRNGAYGAEKLGGR